MTSQRRHRNLVAIAAAAVALGALAPATASAVVAGPNGKLVFTSGRNGPADDSLAKLYLIGIGDILPTQFTTAALRHSHPTFSPDRTKVVYTAGPAASDKDIWIKDVVTGTVTNVTNTPLINEDRATFSPDGTRLAYASEVTNNSNQTDIYVDPLGAGATINLTGTPGIKEDKPIWTPDSKTIFYSFGDIATNASGIYKEPSNNSQVLGTSVLNVAGVNEYQPALSPDGTKLCYTRGGMDNTADIYVVSSTGQGAQTNFSKNAVTGDINCVWSPDSTKIAYVRGIFGAGALVVRAANGTGTYSVIADAAAHFDGNPDWEPDPSPTCQGATVTVAFNDSVSIPLSCTDPAPESETTSKKVATPPEHGDLGSVKSGEPATVLYTPDLDFSGTDSFTFTGSDGTSDSTPEKITVTVLPKGKDTPPVIGPPSKDKRAAVITGLSVSPRTWRRGGLLARLSLAKVGTTISFRLTEPATAGLSFQRAVAGRRVGGRCLPATRARRGRPACIRKFVAAGSLTRAGHTGLNKVKFQGRLSARKRLAIGRYRVVVGATDKAGNRSRKRTSATFSIVVR